MERLLCLCYAENDGFTRTAMEALALTRALSLELSSPFDLGLVGGDLAKAALGLSGAGAHRVLAVKGADFAQGRYASDAAAAEALVKTSAATVVIAPHSPRVARIIAGVAQRLLGRVDTHACSIAVENASLVARRLYYRQRIEARLERTSRPWLLSLEPGSSAPFEPGGGEVPFEAIDVPSFACRTKVQGFSSPPVGEQTIRPEADLLFVAGAGWTKPQADQETHVEEAERLILDFLRLTQASLGGSKSLVDTAGSGEATLRFMNHMNQVGQTGSTPRHPKGLSACCHGEEPHTVGWRFIGERRAINKDPSCGWARGKADVLYVADAFRVMAKVNALLGRASLVPAGALP